MLHRKATAAITAILLVIGLAIVAVASDPRPQPAHAASAVNDKLVPLQGAWWGDYVSSNPADVGPRETLSGRKFDIVHFYEDTSGTFPSTAQANLGNGGRWLFFNIQPRIFGGSSLCWADIAAGSQDTWLTNEANALAAYGQPLFLSFSHEPEGNDGAACDPANGIYGTPAQFISAFRHVHDLMAPLAPKVVWVLNYANPSSSVATSFYPGDAYLDWIAWDPYNWYNCGGHNDPWIQLSDKMAGFYGWAQTNHPSKPLMLAEYGSHQPSGTTPSKGQWFRDAAAQVPTTRPAVKAYVYFDRTGTSGDCQWSVDSSTDSLNGWKAMGADPYFNQPHTTPPITYVGAGKATSGTDVSSIQAVNPAGVLPTDLVLLDLFHSGPDSATVSVPAGCTQVPGSPVKASYGQTWRFVETNVDAATAAPLVTFSTAHRVMAVTYAFRYASGIGPSASTADPVIDTDPTPVPSTLRTAGQLLVVGDGERVAAPPNPTVTPGAGFTERTETSTTQTSFGGGTLELATKPVTTTGTAGGELFQSSVAARDMLIVTALNPSR